MSQSNIASLIESIESIDPASISPEDRLLLHHSAKKWVNRFTTPPELWFRLGYEEPGIMAALKTFGDLGLWEAWIRGGGGEKTAKELSNLANKQCEPELLARLLRLLVTADLIDIRGDKYALTHVAKSFDEPATLATNDIHYGMNLPVMCNLPKFLSDTNYKIPTDSKNSNFSDALNFKGSCFDYFNEKEQMAHNFHDFISWVHSVEPVWTEIYPTEKLLAPSADAQAENDTVLVDVGGGTGRNILFFTNKHKVPRNAVVLQDLEAPISRAESKEVAEAMVHDFFTPQVVKGARAYLLAHVLHDWSDEPSINILKNIRSAMTPGKSRILLYEIVPRPENKIMYGTTMDLVMMATVSAQERTLEEWTKLVRAAGLKIAHVHTHPTAGHAVLELDIDETVS